MAGPVISREFFLRVGTNGGILLETTVLGLKVTRLKMLRDFDFFAQK